MPEPLKASDLIKLLAFAIEQYGDLPVFSQAGEGEGPGELYRRGPVFCVVNGGSDLKPCLDILAYLKTPNWMGKL